ncbi:MAG: hypothetical protein ACK5EA_29610, partial [Planctomycetaceae bacterium]
MLPLLAESGSTDPNSCPPENQQKAVNHFHAAGVFPVTRPDESGRDKQPGHQSLGLGPSKDH